MRDLRWRFGRAWLADSVQELPERLQDAHRSEIPSTFRFDATEAGIATAVAVELKCQTASGGSFFARLASSLEPWDAAELQVNIHYPAELAPDYEINVTQAIKRGIESLEKRPRGSLDVFGIVVHLVDFKAREWERAAAAMCSFTVADVQGGSDQECERLASELCGRISR